MGLFKFKCNHEWKITEVSNILQVDEMGYPLQLVICKCTKCGKSEQQWLDVGLSALEKLKIGEFVLLKWSKV